MTGAINDAADLLALRRLVDVYARTMDDRDVATLSGLFVPGGKLVIEARRTMEFVAPDGFGPVIAGMAGYTRTFYLVGNHICDIEGDRASGETYSIGYHYQAAEDASQRIVANPIRYRDSYVRTDDGWRFEQRVATVQWTDRHEIGGA